MNPSYRREPLPSYETRNREHPLRLSSCDMCQLLIGLNWLINHHELLLKGHAPHSRPDLRWRSDLQRRGKYYPHFKEMIVVLRNRLENKREKGGRLYRLSPFEVSAMMLAARASRQIHLHGLVRGENKHFKRSASSLLKRLENSRKRAKMAMIRSQGIEVYRREAHSWQSFVFWVRLRFLQFRRTVHRPLRYRKELLNSFVEWTRAELTTRGEMIPELRELRRLVRLALRYVRRGRRNYGVASLRRDRNFAADELASFITEQVRKRVETRGRSGANNKRQ